MRVLVLSRDPALDMALGTWLRACGHAMSRVEAIEDVEVALAVDRVDLVVADLVGAPGTTQRVCWLRRLRARCLQVPVIALAAGDDVHERIALLDAGADHCVSRPLAYAELRARVRVWCRRRFGVGERVVRRGPLHFDTVRGVAWCRGRRLDLTRSETLLLACLIERRGRCVAKEDLVDALLEHGFEPSINAVEVHVHRMRRKLDEDQVRISGVRRMGYRLEVRPPAGAEAEDRSQVLAA